MNPQSNSTSPSNSTPSDISMESNVKDVEIQRAYQEAAIHVRRLFFPHYNLYQRIMLKEKIKCYELNKDQPHQYYVCIEGVNEAMKSNRNLLKQQFSTVDATDKQCQNTCKEKYTEGPQYIQCGKQCTIPLRDASISIYKEYYDQLLGDRPEYKNIRKVK